MNPYQLLSLLLLLSLGTFSCKQATIDKPLPTISLNMASSYTTQVGSVVSIKPTLSDSEQNLTYSWMANGIGVSDQLNLDYMPQQPGIFSLSLEIKNQSGKTSSANLKLVVLKNNPFIVMGYLPSWKNANPSTIRWNALTHLCFAFLKVKADGSLNEVDVSGQMKNNIVIR